MSEKVFLESHFNNLLWGLKIFVFINQAKDFIKGNLETASVIHNIFIT